jgi:hypothetical protein
VEQIQNPQTKCKT